MEVRVITSGNPDNNQREQFKQYASVPGDTRDALLDNCLKRAMLEVQAYSNIALLPCTLEVTCEELRKGDTIRLYQGGQTVISATDHRNNTVQFSMRGNSVMLDQDTVFVRLRYSNAVAEAEAEKLMPVVYQYATALYDGEDIKTLSNILKQVITC